MNTATINDNFSNYVTPDYIERYPDILKCFRINEAPEFINFLLHNNVIAPIRHTNDLTFFDLKKLRDCIKSINILVYALLKSAFNKEEMKNYFDHETMTSINESFINGEFNQGVNSISTLKDRLKEKAFKMDFGLSSTVYKYKTVDLPIIKHKYNNRLIRGESIDADLAIMVSQRHKRNPIYTQNQAGSQYVTISNINEAILQEFGINEKVSHIKLLLNSNYIPYSDKRSNRHSRRSFKIFDLKLLKRKLEGDLINDPLM